MPSLISVPLTARGPVSSLSRPIFTGSLGAWARAAGATRRRARTMSPARATHRLRVFFRSMLFPPAVLSQRRPAYGRGESPVNRVALVLLASLIPLADTQTSSIKAGVAFPLKDRQRQVKDPYGCRQTASFWHR